MVQVVQGKEGFGSLLGRHIGGGLQESLNALAQNKLQSMLQTQQSPGFIDAAVKAGFAPDIANFMAQLPPPALTAFLQRLNPSDFAPQGEQLAQSLEQLNPQQEQPLEQQLQATGQIPPLTGQDALMRAIQEYQQQAPQQQMNAQVPTAPLQSPQAQQTRTPSAAEIFSRPSPREEREERRHQETLTQKERLANQKHNEKYIESALDREDANEKDLAVLERIVHLQDAGKVQTGLVQFFKLAGFDINALKNADTNEMEKLTNWFLRGGTKLFGGKVSNQEMMAIINSVPNALQNKDAAKQLARQMVTQKKWENEEAKMIRKLRKEYGKQGVPYDFRDIVKERMEEVNKRYHTAFVQGIPVEDVGKPSGLKAQQLSAAQYKGQLRRNKRTGQIERSNGREWVPE